VTRVGDLVPLVHVVRISDRRHRHDRRRHVLDRVARMDAIIAALCDSGYDGPIEFDFWTDDDRAACEYSQLLGECRSRFEAAMACAARAV
jgi:hypothetical protein